MSAQTSGDESHKLGDFGVDTGEMTGAEWRRRWHACNEDFGRLAESTGLSKREVMDALREIGVIDVWEDYYVHRCWPHEFGLSALNCADCGAQGIQEYPCPDCGHEGGTVDE